MIKVNNGINKEFLESRYIAYPDGRVYSKYFHKFLKPCYNHDGYIRYHIQVIEDGKSVSRLISAHRIIALLLIPNPENKPYINHKNGNKSDNRIENLEWVTQKENIAYCVKNGTHSSQKNKNTPVLQINKHEKIVAEYKNYGAASRAMGCKKDTDIMYAISHYKTKGIFYRGYGWKYKDTSNDYPGME